MRTAAAGGARDRIADGSQVPIVVCGRPQSTTCVLVQHEGPRLIVVWTQRSDWETARGLPKPVSNPAAPDSAAMSADGRRLALLLPLERTLRILSLAGEPQRDVRVSDRPFDATVFHWSADGARLVRVEHAATLPGGYGPAAHLSGRPRASDRAPERARRNGCDSVARRPAHRHDPDEHGQERVDVEALNRDARRTLQGGRR